MLRVSPRGRRVTVEPDLTVWVLSLSLSLSLSVCLSLSLSLCVCVFSHSLTQVRDDMTENKGDMVDRPNLCSEKRYTHTLTHTHCATQDVVRYFKLLCRPRQRRRWC